MREKFEELLQNKYVNKIISKWHLISVALISIFMFLIRIRSRENFFSDGKVYFSGNDAWYHFHQTMYTVKNWPKTNFYDPFTGYPSGAEVGHFGTLYDQIMATVSMIVGLGDPSVQTVRTVMVYFPPALGALTALVVYMIGRTLINKKLGVLSALLLSLIPGTFLRRTTIGFADHHAAEVFFLSIAVLISIYVFKKASEKKFIIEDFKQRGDSFKDLIKLSGLLSIGFLLYILVWPPGIMMVGITGVFYLLYSVFRTMFNKSHESILLVGGLSNLFLMFLLIPFARISTTSSTIIGIIHILALISIGVGCFYLIFLQRKLEFENYESFYPVVVIFTGIISIALLWFAAPSVLDSIRRGIVSNFGLSVSDSLRTIGEAQSMVSRGGLLNQFISSYGGLTIFALIFFSILPLSNYVKDSNYFNLKPEYTYLTVFFIMMVIAAMTQVRYNYYLAVAISIVSALSVYLLVKVLSSKKKKDSKGWYYISITIILIVLIAPTAPFIGFTNVYEQTGSSGPGGYTQWEGSLEWVGNNTPETDLEKYKDYGKDYQYTGKDYGIMSWWDYGHWITVTADRIPYANPFQQNAPEAADFLLAQSENEAEKVVESMGDESERRYVMIDWQMISPTSKFRAPTVWSTNYNSSQFTDRLYAPIGQRRISAVGVEKEQPYYESLMSRLYNYHGSYKSKDPVIINYEERMIQQNELKVIPSRTSPYQKAENMTKAEQILQENGGSIGGIGIHPKENVEALEHYRYVYGSEASVERSRNFLNTVRRASRQNNLQASDFIISRSFVKVFEKVPGAKIKGTGAEPNTTVTAIVPLTEPNNGDRFRYRQNAEVNSEGEFSLTLPYSTTGYDNFGPEDGNTNISVRATSDYRIVSTTKASRGSEELTVVEDTINLEVPEKNVISEDSSPIEVEFNNSSRLDSIPDSQLPDFGSTESEKSRNRTNEDSRNISPNINRTNNSSK